MILSFHPCFVADAQIILGDRDLNSNDLACIRDAEVIILPQSCSHSFYRECKQSSALLFPDYDARFTYPGKFGQSLLFKEIGCPHPKTLPWSSVEKCKKEYQGDRILPHETPFLIKLDKAHEAEGTYLIQDLASLESALKNLTYREGSGSPGFVTQELISSEGNVLRAVILGKRIVTYWKRPEKPGQSAGRGCSA